MRTVDERVFLHYLPVVKTRTSAERMVGCVMLHCTPPWLQTDGNTSISVRSVKLRAVCLHVYVVPALRQSIAAASVIPTADYYLFVNKYQSIEWVSRGRGMYERVC